jgi:hypothetical protein
MAGLLVVGFVCNLMVRPVSEAAGASVPTNGDTPPGARPSASHRGGAQVVDTRNVEAADRAASGPS